MRSTTAQRRADRSSYVLRGRDIRWLPLLLCIALPLAAQLLSACGTPTRARVESRELERAPAKPSRRAKPPARYRVRKGDTLFSIAWRYGFDYRRLAALNKIHSPYVIYPGQHLRFTRPVSSSRPPGESTIKRTPAKGSARGEQRAPRKTAPTTRAAKPNKSGKQAQRKLRWRWPTKGAVVQRYKKGDPTRKGIEISGRAGQPVVAAEAGKVVYAGSGLIGYGRLIIIKHNKNYLSAYGHNRKLRVTEGTSVSKGQTVAELGNKGTGGSVLHFEIRRNGSPVDPLQLLP